MKLRDLLREAKIESLLKKKGEWVLLSSSGEALGMYKTLIDLVGTAYSGTKLGSFLKYRSDINRSQYWEVIDLDDDPDPDVCIFGRRQGRTEKWRGIKIQGIGHDGQRISKDAAIAKVVKQLGKSGFWIEASDAMEHILRKSGARVCSEEEVQKAFVRGVDEYHSDGSYIRKLPNDVQVEETAFGNIKF